jgi:hypothetical protein
MGSLLRHLLGGKQRQPAALITGVVGADPKGGWSVTWAGEGLWPPCVHAASLTQAADQAATAVVALYAQHPPVPDAELQLAIYPWRYQGGPMFDISGHAGALTARDIHGELSVSGTTLEDLVAAVRHIPGLPAGDSMFRWVRQVASLPAVSP